MEAAIAANKQKEAKEADKYSETAAEIQRKKDETIAARAAKVKAERLERARREAARIRAA